MSTVARPVMDVAIRRPDLRRPWRIIAAVSIVTGPLLITILRAVMPYWTNDDPATAVAAMTANPGGLTAMNWLAVLSYPFLVLGAIGIWMALRRRVPVLGTVSTGVLFLALTLGSMLGSSDVLAEALLNAGWDEPLVAETTLLLMDHPTGLLGILSFVVGHLVGLVLIGIAAWRARLIPWWAGLMLILAQPVHVISAVVMPSRALDVIGGWGITTVVFAIIAMAVWRMPDDEWDLPPA